MLKKYSILGVFILGLFMISCSSDDNGGSQSNHLPKSLIINSTNYVNTYNFTYNGNKLKSIVDSDGLEYTYTYEGNHITKMVGDYGGGFVDTYKFQYENGKLSKIVFTDEDGNEVAECDWVSNDHMQVQTSEGDQLDYYYDNGNLIKEVGQGEEDGTTYKDTYSYEYDSHPNYMKNVKGFEKVPFLAESLPFELIPGENNVTKMIESELWDGETDDYAENYSYKYDDDGYPTKVTVDGGSSTIDIIYNE